MKTLSKLKIPKKAQPMVTESLLAGSFENNIHPWKLEKFEVLYDKSKTPQWEYRYWTRGCILISRGKRKLFAVNHTAILHPRDALDIVNSVVADIKKAIKAAP